ncbi:hypothetical protein NDU88_005658 [Pleurodeles waltl]|uniref:Uncharacterized protein n=1 Tax=Pleurodeles waltl TaxID=8319 RepID=A0AAV7WZC8_PLEWA|nr:hypothetical protein NDU88_005658 [Pleurodeles waltl]
MQGQSHTSLPYLVSVHTGPIRSGTTLADDHQTSQVHSEGGGEGEGGDPPPLSDLTADRLPGTSLTPATLPSKGGHLCHQSFPAGGALGPPNARSRPCGHPTSRPCGPGLQGKAAIPRRGERRPSIVEEMGGPAAQHHCRYGPPEHPNERCHGGPPGPRGKAQTSPTQRGSREHAVPRRGRFDPRAAPQLPPLQRGEAANIRRPPPSHRSASSVLAGEFSKLGPCRSRASRSAGRLAAG